MPDLPAAAALARQLAAWFGEHARDLPWRRDPSPYHVLLSELMLQQTRVETVVPYFERFVARWPDLAALAAATEEEVLAAWAGLGYYSRARNLHRCAIAARDAGGLPADPGALRALPGIGPYTAGAVASIAFGVRAPLVDGNVERVLCRVDGRQGDPRREEKAGLWARAENLLAAAPEIPAGVVNQALMELGALVCLPRAPRCGACPVHDLCRARDHDPESLPRKAPKPKPREMRHTALLATIGDALVLGRRGPGLLGGLWEPLRIEGDDRGGLRQLAGGVDLRYLGEIVHVFTHRRLTCTVYSAVLTTVPAAPHGYTEVRTILDPESVGLSALARRVLALRNAPPLPLAAEPAPRR